MRPVGRGLLVGLGAFLLTLASSWVERFGPDQAVYCALGKSSDGHEIWCPEPVLNGGWPAPFLYDRPGISVERQLSVFEDDFRAAPFFADFGCFALILLLLWQAVQKLRGRSADRRINPNSSSF